MEWYYMLVLGLVTITIEPVTAFFRIRQAQKDLV